MVSGGTDLPGETATIADRVSISVSHLQRLEVWNGITGMRISGTHLIYAGKAV